MARQFVEVSQDNPDVVIERAPSARFNEGDRFEVSRPNESKLRDFATLDEARAWIRRKTAERRI